MSIEIYTLKDQGTGNFDHGRILENKPIGFPGEGGKLSPYSNLFYWAHAWSDDGGLIGEHPHRGFEIMSFVLEGEIQHYDSSHGDWKTLKKGDAQIIRSGNGITHAERLLRGAGIFQIWLDPNLGKTLYQPASYDDFRSEEFPVIDKDGYLVKIYKGEGSPMEMDAEGITILRYSFDQVNPEIELDAGSVYSCYLLAGRLEINGRQLMPKDFAVISGQPRMKINSLGASDLFVVGSPESPGYKTYAGS